MPRLEPVAPSRPPVATFQMVADTPTAEPRPVGSEPIAPTVSESSAATVAVAALSEATADAKAPAFAPAAPENADSLAADIDAQGESAVEPRIPEPDTPDPTEADDLPGAGAESAAEGLGAEDDAVDATPVPEWSDDDDVAAPIADLEAGDHNEQSAITSTDTEIPSPGAPDDGGVTDPERVLAEKAPGTADEYDVASGAGDDASDCAPAAVEATEQADPEDRPPTASAGSTEDPHVDPDADVDAEALKKMFQGPMVARESGLDADERSLLAGVSEMAADPEDAQRARAQSVGADDGDAEPRIPTALQADYARLHARKPSVVARTLIILASVLALIALPVQYAWFEPQDLVTRYPQARPYVAAFCNHAKCAQLLPEDRSKIELLGRDVRIHPRFEGALQIRATIVNRGNYAQTYPQVRFTLFNDNGNVIASRLFTPAEYLRRTDVGLLRLQAGETSQIQLDLIAPEDTAVSFEFEFI